MHCACRVIAHLTDINLHQKKSIRLQCIAACVRNLAGCQYMDVSVVLVAIHQDDID
jgi:hypothetical protein